MFLVTYIMYYKYKVTPRLKIIVYKPGKYNLINNNYNLNLLIYVKYRYKVYTYIIEVIFLTVHSDKVIYLFKYKVGKTWTLIDIIKTFCFQLKINFEVIK